MKYGFKSDQYLSGDTSVTTVSCTSIDCDSLSSTDSVWQTNRTVRFATSPDGNVQCEVIYVEKYDDPELWWHPSKINELRSACQEIVSDSARNSPISLSHATLRFLNCGWKENPDECLNVILQLPDWAESGGLERRILFRCRDIVHKHVKGVLRVQATTKSEHLLRLASRQTSHKWIEFCQILAEMEAEEIWHQ